MPAATVAGFLAVAAVVEHVARKQEDRERGREALGRHPGGRAVRRLFVHAKLARHVDDVRTVGPVTRDGDTAWTAIVELPPGVTADKAIKRRAELAGAIGVDVAQVALDPVPGHAGRVAVWCADSDPLAGPSVRSPLVARTAPFDVWTERIVTGVDVRGRPVSFSLVERSILVGGEPGAGKSVACNVVLCTLALDPHVPLWLADGKGGADLLDYEDVAERFLQEPDPAAMLAMLGDAQDEMSDRYRKLRKLGKKKLTKKIADEIGVRPIVLHVDELQSFVTAKRYGDDIVDALWDIVSRGRAGGIIVSGAIRLPGGDVVPTKLRDILSIPWALRCTTPQASDTILGQGWASRGYSAATLDATQRGAGILYAEGSAPISTRSYLLDDPEVTAIARQAYRLREQAGTLPKSDARPAVRLLKAILAAFGDRDRAWTADLLDELTQHQAYEGWDATRLADELRPLGVSPRQIAIDGTNRNGYLRGDVLRALDRA